MLVACLFVAIITTTLCEAPPQPLHNLESIFYFEGYKGNTCFIMIIIIIISVVVVVVIITIIITIIISIITTTTFISNPSLTRVHSPRTGVGLEFPERTS